MSLGDFYGIITVSFFFLQKAVEQSLQKESQIAQNNRRQGKNLNNIPRFDRFFSAAKFSFSNFNFFSLCVHCNN